MPLDVMCHSGERSRLFTPQVGVQVYYFVVTCTTNRVCHRACQSIIHHFEVTSCKCSWFFLTVSSKLYMYLQSNCHTVQRFAPPSLDTLADDTEASCDTCHCYRTWSDIISLCKLLQFIYLNKSTYLLSRQLKPYPLHLVLEICVLL